MAKRQVPSHKPSKLPKHRPGPEGGVRDRNRQDTLRRLADAGLALFLAEGTAAVSIDDIVEATGIAKGSFYRYVSDKAELVGLIIGGVAAEVIQALDRCEHALQSARRDKLAATYLELALELAAVVAREPARVLLYLQEARAPRGGARGAIHALADQLTAKTIALTEIARDHRLIREVDPRIAALTVLGAIDSILFAYLRDRGGVIDAAIVTGELVAIIVDGIGR
ncbi:MAG: TetR/AcrR family transcriptional regulator [Kofleriaceae bacterium]